MAALPTEHLHSEELCPLYVPHFVTLCIQRQAQVQTGLGAKDLIINVLLKFSSQFHTPIARGPMRLSSLTLVVQIEVIEGYDECSFGQSRVTREPYAGIPEGLVVFREEFDDYNFHHGTGLQLNAPDLLTWFQSNNGQYNVAPPKTEDGSKGKGKALWAKLAVYDITTDMGAAFYMSCLSDSRGMYARMQSCDSIGGEVQFGGWDVHHLEGRGPDPYNTVPLVGVHVESCCGELILRLDFLMSEYDNIIHEPCRYGHRHNGKRKDHITQSTIITSIPLTEKFEDHDVFMLKLMRKLPWTKIHITPESRYHCRDPVANALFSAASIDLFFINRHFGPGCADELVGPPPTKAKHLWLIAEIRKFSLSDHPGAAAQLVAREMVVVPELFQFNSRTGKDFEEIKPDELVDRAAREKLDPCPLVLALGKLPGIQESNCDSAFEVTVQVYDQAEKRSTQIYHAKSLSEEDAFIQRKWIGNEAGNVNQLMSYYQQPPEPEDPKPAHHAVFFKAVSFLVRVPMFAKFGLFLLIVDCCSGASRRRRSICASQSWYHAVVSTPGGVLHRR